MKGRSIVTLDLEYGNPDVASAISRMRNDLATYRRLGYKAAVLIHGYGSTGIGGSIRAAVKNQLDEKSMRGIIKKHTGGEDWLIKRGQFTSVCKALEKYERQISGNPGVTVAIFR